QPFTPPLVGLVLVIRSYIGSTKVDMRDLEASPISLNSYSRKLTTLVIDHIQRESIPPSGSKDFNKTNHDMFNGQGLVKVPNAPLTICKFEYDLHQLSKAGKQLGAQFGSVSKDMKTAT
uniref:Uncharacterized protein n=1 Tax=Oryza glaberrima TaxID=4538 RepID=I1NTF1_ORYGL